MARNPGTADLTEYSEGVFHMDHCINCIDIRCNVRVGCHMRKCPLKCGAIFHVCKEQDHFEICQEAVTFCYNKDLGCQQKMKRRKMKNHLASCPANLVTYRKPNPISTCDICQLAGTFGCGNHCDTFDLHCSNIDSLKEDDVAPISQIHSSANEGPRPTSATEASLLNPQESLTNGDTERENVFTRNIYRVPWQLGSKGSESMERENLKTNGLKHGSHEAGSIRDMKSRKPLLPSLDSLPLMVLVKIASFLDAVSLESLSLVSHRMRRASASHLRRKGMVQIVWGKVNGKWIITQKIWYFQLPKAH